MCLDRGMCMFECEHLCPCSSGRSPWRSSTITLHLFLQVRASHEPKASVPQLEENPAGPGGPPVSASQKAEFMLLNEIIVHSWLLTHPSTYILASNNFLAWQYNTDSRYSFTLVLNSSVFSKKG